MIGKRAFETGEHVEVVSHKNLDLIGRKGRVTGFNFGAIGELTTNYGETIHRIAGHSWEKYIVNLGDGQLAQFDQDQLRKLEPTAIKGRRTSARALPASSREAG